MDGNSFHCTNTLEFYIRKPDSLNIFGINTLAVTLLVKVD